MADKILVEYSADTAGLLKDLQSLIDKNDALDKKVNQLINGSLPEFQKKATVAFGNDQLDKFNNSLADAVTKANKLEKSGGSLTLQLRAMKQALTLMENEGLIGTKAFENLAIKAGKLQDKLGDTAQRIRVLASDTKNLDAALQIGTGVAGAFAVAQGAAALFGKENQDLQKTLVKVQSALAILNGLQAISNVLNKDSAARIVVVSAVQNLYATTTGVLTGKIALATIAQRIWNAVISANPIGLIVTAVVLLTTAIGQLIFAESEAEKKQKALNTQLSFMALTSRENIDFINQEKEALKARQDANIKIIESQGATEKQISEQKLKDLQAQGKLNEDLKTTTLGLLQIEADKLKNTSKSSKEYAEQSKVVDDLIDQVKKLENEQLGISSNYIVLQNAIDGTTESAKKQQKELKNLTEAGKIGSIGYYNYLLSKINEELLKLVPGTDEYNKKLKEQVNIQNDLTTAILNTAEGRKAQSEADKIARDEIKKGIEDESKSRSEILRDRNKLEKDAADERTKIEQDGFDERKKLRDLEFETEKELIDKLFEIATNISKASSDRKIADAKNSADEEIANEDRLLKTKKISQENYTASVSIIKANLDKTTKKFQHDEAVREKELALAKAVIDTALGIVAALTSIPPNVPLSVAVGITGALQLGVIASQPIPKFAKGIIDLKGRGTETSDSIPAWLSKGESVINAEKTRKYKSELTALHSGDFEQMIYKNYVLPEVMKIQMKVISDNSKNISVNASLDDSNMVKAFSKNKGIDYNKMAEAIHFGNQNSSRRTWN